MTEEDKEFPRLVIMQSVRPPDPFDPHIFSLSLRTDQNDPSAVFDLLLSATIGSEVVRFDNEEEAMECRISIRKIEIVLDFINCNPLGNFEPEKIPLSQLTRADSIDSRSALGEKNSSNRRSKFGARSSAFVGDALAKLIFSSDTENSDEYEKSKSQSYESRVPSTSRLNDSTISIGFSEEESPALIGSFLSDYRGWRIVPKERVHNCGVVARGRVRENWIDVDKLTVLSSKSSFGMRIGLLSGTGKHARSQKHRAFNVLLRHLVMCGLQQESEKEYATLACDALILEPHAERLNKVSSFSERPPITLNTRALIEIIEVEPGGESEILKRYGVPSELIDQEKIVDQPEKLETRNDIIILRDKIEKIFLSHLGIFNPKVKSKIVSGGLGQRDLFSNDSDKIQSDRSGINILHECGNIFLSSLSQGNSAVRIAKKYSQIGRRELYSIEDLATIGALVDSELVLNISKELSLNLKYSTIMERRRVRNIGMKVGSKWLYSINEIRFLLHPEVDLSEIIESPNFRRRLANSIAAKR